MEIPIKSFPKPPVPPMPESEWLKYKSTVEQKTIFEVLQNICEKNDLCFGQAMSSIFGSDLCLFHKTNEELLEIINEKKIKLNLK
jgi:hypothetical protein